LFGVFDRRGLAFLVELLDGLSVLISLIVLIGRWGSGLLRRILLRRIGLLRRILLLGRILLVTLLRLGLIANSEYSSLSWRGRSRQRLVRGDWGHIGVCGVRTRCKSCLSGVQIAMTPCGSGEW
jgi:hypothetical protein